MNDDFCVYFSSKQLKYMLKILESMSSKNDKESAMLEPCKSRLEYAIRQAEFYEKPRKR